MLIAYMTVEYLLVIEYCSLPVWWWELLPLRTCRLLSLLQYVPKIFGLLALKTIDHSTVIRYLPASGCYIPEVGIQKYIPATFSDYRLFLVDFGHLYG